MLVVHSRKLSSSRVRFAGFLARLWSSMFEVGVGGSYHHAGFPPDPRSTPELCQRAAHLFRNEQSRAASRKLSVLKACRHFGEVVRGVGWSFSPWFYSTSPIRFSFLMGPSTWPSARADQFHEASLATGGRWMTEGSRGGRFFRAPGSRR